MHLGRGHRRAHSTECCRSLTASHRSADSIPSLSSRSSSYGSSIAIHHVQRHQQGYRSGMQDLSANPADLRTVIILQRNHSAGRNRRYCLHVHSGLERDRQAGCMGSCVRTGILQPFHCLCDNDILLQLSAEGRGRCQHCIPDCMHQPRIRDLRRNRHLLHHRLHGICTAVRRRRRCSSRRWTGIRRIPHSHQHAARAELPVRNTLLRIPVHSGRYFNDLHPADGDHRYRGQVGDVP